MEEKRFKLNRDEMQVLVEMHSAKEGGIKLRGLERLLDREEIKLLLEKNLIIYKEDEPRTVIFELTENGAKIAEEVDKMTISIQKWTEEFFENKLQDLENHIFTLKPERRG